MVNSASIIFKDSIEHLSMCFIYLSVCLQALFETIETWIQLSDLLHLCERGHCGNHFYIHV